MLSKFLQVTHTSSTSIIPQDFRLNVKKNTEWDTDLFNRFLKLVIISNDKAYRVDCRFEETGASSLKQLLLTVRDELLKRKDKGKTGILILRMVGDKPIIFRIRVEQYKDSYKTDKTRFCLDFFCNAFLKDTKNNLRMENWEESIPDMKYQSNNKNIQINIIRDLISLDFLRISDDNGMTRLNCYSVPLVDNYSFTILLYKLFKILGIEPREIMQPEDIENFHQQYMEQAQNAFIKDASVAKAQQGFAYQEHLIMLLAYLAKEDPNNKDFSLVGEAMVPEAWNDVLLEWNKQLIFFQQKHRSLYSASVKETYSKTEILAKEGDVSILKYYHAYRKLIKTINDSQHPLYKYQTYLKNKSIKFIFFSNRNFQISENSGSFYLEGEKDVKLENVDSNQIPLNDLKGFEQVIDKQKIWRIKSLDASKLELPPSKQATLNEFFSLFYLFLGQKNSNELFQHCKDIIMAPLEGFGQAVLADTFAHYIHRLFIEENPKNHVFSCSDIKDFFNNHEYYHYNLVKYSCYNYPSKAISELVKKHLPSLKELSCFKELNQLSKDESKINISCQDPLLALEIIQKLFPAGERQIFTPFSLGVTTYQIIAGVKHVIIVGENNEINRLIEEIKKRNEKNSQNKRIKIIQIKLSVPQTQINGLTLQIKVDELKFLYQEYPCLSILKDNTLMCLTDWLLLSSTYLMSEFSIEEQSRYIPQRLTDEKVILPFDKLEIAIKEWVSKNQSKVDNSWFFNDNIMQCKIRINLPAYLLEKSIQSPSSKKFVWDQQKKELYYIQEEKVYHQVAFYPDTISNNIDFNGMEKNIKIWINEKNPFVEFPTDYSDVIKIVSLELNDEYNGNQPLQPSWDLSKDKKYLIFYPYFKQKLCNLDWKSFYSDKTISIIEAEAACGKTWHLKSKISLEQIQKYGKIPIFIRIKDMENVKNFEDPISELLNQSSVPAHISRMANQYPEYFHLLLDGFDEFSSGFSKNFERILNNITSKEYSITATVRDYQKDKLQKQTDAIIIEQRLNKFNKQEINWCLQKSLSKKIPVDEEEVLKLEISTLCDWLEGQANISQWLGVPFHIILISEWYIYNRERFLNSARPSISEIYNFIIKNRVKRNSKRSPGDIYKILNKISWLQIFGKKDLFGIISIKNYRFKKELNFDLERIGLIRNPYAENQELSHRTFAEFLVAKKLSQRIIGLTCKDNVANFEIIRLLYQMEYRLVCHFFIELFKRHRLDPDVPYEIPEDVQMKFEQLWLKDITGQELTKYRNEKLVTWDNSLLSSHLLNKDSNQFLFMPFLKLDKNANDKEIHQANIKFFLN